MIDVIACRCLVDLKGSHSTYFKQMKLPIHPFVGMGVCIEKGLDPVPITEVFVNENGVAVCVFHDDDYSHASSLYTEEEWLSTVECFYGAWEKLCDDQFGVTMLYDRELNML